jgi:hypothetical protein
MYTTQMCINLKSLNVLLIVVYVHYTNICINLKSGNVLLIVAVGIVMCVILKRKLNKVAHSGFFAIFWLANFI